LRTRSIASGTFRTKRYKAAAGVAEANRELVGDELAATTGEDGRTAGETCSLLLAPAGGEPSDEAAVWEYGAADCGAAGGKRVGDGSEVRIIETE
jgi:hypothetical protein